MLVRNSPASDSSGEPYPGRECLLGRIVAVDDLCMFLALHVRYYVLLCHIMLCRA